MKSSLVNGHSSRLQTENQQLRGRLTEAEETLQAIRNGDVDAVVVNGHNGQKIYSLEQTENLYRRLAETVYEPMVALNEAGTIVFFNDRLQELLEMSAAQIVGRRMVSLICPEDRQSFERLLNKARHVRGERVRASLVSARKTTVSVHWRANPLDSDDGRLTCLVGTDLTQIEASEETIEALEMQRQQLLAAQIELEKSRERYANLYNSAPVGYLNVAWNGIIREINQAGGQILGANRFKLQSPLICHVVQEDRKKLLQHFALCKQLGNRLSVEVQLEARRGRKTAYVEIVSVAMKSEEGQGFNTIITDITARKEAELAVRESELRFRSLADSAPVLIWMSGADQICTYVNQQHLDFTGRTLEEQLNQGWTASVHPDDVKRCVDAYDAACGARRRFDLEYRFRRRDGGYRWMLAYGAPRFDATGDFVGYIGSCVDITQRREMETKLELMSRFPQENPWPVMRLQNGRTVNYANPAARDVMRFWKIRQGGEVPRPIARIAQRALLAKERQVRDVTVGSRQFQVQFAPIPAGGYVNLYFDDVTARKRSEHELRESEERFRTLASHAPVGIFMSKLNGEAVYVNEYWCQMAGVTPAEAMGKGWLNTVHPEDFRRIASGWRQAVKQRDSSHAEFRFQRPDGTVVWTQGHASRLKNAAGQTLGYIGTAADITRRKLAEEALQRAHADLEARVRVRTRDLTRANAALKREIVARERSESALRESEERSRLMIEGTRDYAIFMLDAKGRVATWNKGAELVNGYKANEILGQHFSCFYTEQDRRRGRPKRVLDTARRLGRVVEEGWRCPKRKKQFWANVIVTALRDNRGRVKGFLKVTRDVTESRKAQEELRANEQRLADFFNQSPLGLLWVGRTGKIQRINRAGLDLLGAALEEGQRTSVQEFAIDPDEITHLLQRILKHESVQNYRVRLRRRHGSVRHVLIDANGWWEHGRMVYSRWFVRDVTRQVELEREILTVAEQERQRLGQDLHDDLCQQLTGIEFLSQTLAGQLASNSAPKVERAREIARMIRQAITHTRDLAHGLSPTELEADGLTGALQQLADRTHSMFRVACRFRCKAPIEFKDSELGIHLYRIAQEAVTNAVKHGKANRLTILLALSKKELVLSVTDNGSGLPPGPHKSRGMGLRVMQYRAGVIGGKLEFHRNTMEGTTVTCSVSNALINAKGKTYDENHEKPSSNGRSTTASVHRR